MKTDVIEPKEYFGPTDASGKRTDKCPCFRCTPLDRTEPNGLIEGLKNPGVHHWDGKGWWFLDAEVQEKFFGVVRAGRGL